MLVVMGHIRDFFGSISGLTRYPGAKPRKGYSVLLKSWESFYTRRLYHRIQDCWNRPIKSCPGAHIDVMLRDSKDNNRTLNITGESINCLNMGSYNYLGFGDNWEESCGPVVLPALQQWPISMSSSRADFGNYTIVEELERFLADFLGQESVLVYSMGYGTNSNTLPALMGRGSLIISDSLNHTSLVNGSRGSSAQIRVFHRND